MGLNLVYGGTSLGERENQEVKRLSVMTTHGRMRADLGGIEAARLRAQYFPGFFFFFFFWLCCTQASSNCLAGATQLQCTGFSLRQHVGSS